MENEPETIKEIKEDIAKYRHRLSSDWNDIRSAVNPKDLVEDAIRQHPASSMALAAAAGVLAVNVILPTGRKGPLGAIMGGAVMMAYRAMLMAATPLIARRLAEVIDPPGLPANGARAVPAPATTDIKEHQF